MLRLVTRKSKKSSKPRRTATDHPNITHEKPPFLPAFNSCVEARFCSKNSLCAFFALQDRLLPANMFARLSVCAAVFALQHRSLVEQKSVLDCRRISRNFSHKQEVNSEKSTKVEHRRPIKKTARVSEIAFLNRFDFKQKTTTHDHQSHCVHEKSRITQLRSG